eukprot:2907198-Prorocentrum_lima.AAC.1
MARTRARPTRRPKWSGDSTGPKPLVPSSSTNSRANPRSTNQSSCRISTSIKSYGSPTSRKEQ